MPNTVTSPNMTIVVPVPSVETGPQWATDLYNALYSTIDAHDHSSGKGVQVTPAGLNINADLGFGSFNATALRTTRYTSQNSALSLGTDIGCLYNVSGDAYWNDAAGTQIQLTKSHRIAPSSLMTTVLGVTGTLTILSTDRNQLYWVNTTGAVTINLPAASTVPVGTYYELVDYLGTSETHAISVVPSGSDTIDTVNATYSFSQNSGSLRLTTDGVSKWTAVPSGISSLRASGMTFPASATVSFTQSQQTSGAGTAWTFTSQAAQASGNISGADFIFNTGAGNGTGLPGKFRTQGAGIDVFQFWPWVGSSTHDTQTRKIEYFPFEATTTQNTAFAVVSLAVPTGACQYLRVQLVARQTAANAEIFNQDFVATNNAGTVTVASIASSSASLGTPMITGINMFVSGTNLQFQVQANTTSSVDWQGLITRMTN